MMNMTHLQPLLGAMERGDDTTLADHLSEEIVFRSPIRPEPVDGKAAVLRLLVTLLKVSDSFEVTSTLETNGRVVIGVKICAGEVTTEGLHDIQVDENGLVTSMTQFWRPLPAVVAVQQRMTTALGLRPLKLVPATE